MDSRAFARHYSLLADDYAPESSDPKARYAFRAHIILNIILYGRIAFSDNQIICSPNLRHALKWDGVIRELTKLGRITIAARDIAFETSLGSEIFDAFVKYKKISDASIKSLSYAESSEVSFAFDNCPILKWNIDSVSRRWKSATQRSIAHKLGDAFNWNADDYERLDSLWFDVAKTPEGFSKIYAETTFIGDLERSGISLPLDPLPTISKCISANYVANLPKECGFSPIYSGQHRDAFDLVRESAARSIVEKSPERVRRTLISQTQFVRGLIELPVDAVLDLEKEECVLKFRSLFASSEFDEGQAEEALALMWDIETAIEEKICEIALGSRSAGEGATTRYRIEYLKNVGKNSALDAFQLVMEKGFELAAPFFGTIVGIVMDAMQRDQRLKEGRSKMLRAQSTAKQRQHFISQTYGSEILTQEVEFEIKNSSSAVTNDLDDDDFSSENIMK